MTTILIFALCFGLASALPTIASFSIPSLASQNLNVSQPDGLDPKFSFTFEAGGTKLPEIPSYMVAIRSMVEQALGNYDADVAPGHMVQDGVELLYGGNPLSSKISRPLLLLGLYASVRNWLNSGQMVTGKYNLVYSGKHAGHLEYVLPSSGSVGQAVGSDNANASSLFSKRDSGPPSNRTKVLTHEISLSNRKRPVSCTFEFKGSATSPAPYLSLIAHTIFQIAPNLPHFPAHNFTYTYQGLRSTFKQWNELQQGPSFAIWEDAIRMLGLAAKVAVHEGVFRGMKMTASYGSEEEIGVEIATLELDVLFGDEMDGIQVI